MWSRTRPPRQSFDELIESEVTIVVLYIKPMVELCIRLTQNQELEDSLRVKSITFMGQLPHLKRKTIVSLDILALHLSPRSWARCSPPSPAPAPPTSGPPTRPSPCPRRYYLRSSEALSFDSWCQYEADVDMIKYFCDMQKIFFLIILF